MAATYTRMDYALSRLHVPGAWTDRHAELRARVRDLADWAQRTNDDGYAAGEVPAVGEEGRRRVLEHSAALEKLGYHGCAAAV
jgi:hypothetical protein